MSGLMALSILAVLGYILYSEWKQRKAARDTLRARMTRPALLTDEEQAAWERIERGYETTAEGNDD